MNTNTEIVMISKEAKLDVLFQIKKIIERREVEEVKYPRNYYLCHIINRLASSEHFMYAVPTITPDQFTWMNKLLQDKLNNGKGGLFTFQASVRRNVIKHTPNIPFTRINEIGYAIADEKCIPLINTFRLKWIELMITLVESKEL